MAHDEKQPPPPPAKPTQFDKVTHGADTETFETKIVESEKPR